MIHAIRFSMVLVAISTSTAKNDSEKWFNQTMNNQNHSFKQYMTR